MNIPQPPLPQRERRRAWSRRRSAATRRARAGRAGSTSIATGSSRERAVRSPAPVDRTELRRPTAPTKSRSSPSASIRRGSTLRRLGEATATARALVKGVRAHKPSGVDAFLHAYDLGSRRGHRDDVPGRGAAAHSRRAHRRRADRRQAGRARTGRRSSAQSDSAFVNAATFSLLLTGKVLEGAQDRSRQLAGGARPRRRPPRRAGGPHRGARGDEDPRPQFRVRPRPSTKR